jgi:chromosome segregation ATPase
MQNTADLVTKSELKAELEALESRLDQNLTAMEQRLGARIDAQEQKFEGRMDVRDERMREFMSQLVHDSETKLLQAFYGYAESTERHLKQLDMSSAGLLVRVSTLESRVMEVEKRLNIPPIGS